MWVGHYASAFIAKPFAPGIPLSVLALASSAADALFFLLNFAGLESFNLDPAIVARSGCFPYTNDYPYSHSLVGMGVAGAAVAFGYKLLSPGARVSLTDFAVITATGLSHFLLELPVHRKDVKITPHDDVAAGAGWFDSPVVDFLAENALFLASLWFYTRFAPKVTQTGWLTNKGRLTWIALFFAAQQAQFCFMAAPTQEARWVHAPLFLGMILGSSWLLGKLES
ncbi:uncharacterized protein C8Q71DRAFT_809565 [Rhodofomes roseus]|uniref:LexA-binding, inner membrane-associated hydrolase n=1 Tax=Rhodofomes roseus TaxID=34475 RepID=A0ABQ8KIX4_9APHY|nr:uncharacterized protein C8Q71DRAFT_809565 [Rhodofomes roseus]KAH9837342.1 hypothetical protein C8Q71DRAFT_809565 [Rhodofomes roseus]